MKVFSSKLELNQSLNSDASLVDGQVVVVMKAVTAVGEKESKYVLRKCIDCGELFFQHIRAKQAYVRCKDCGSMTKKKKAVPDECK